MAPRVPFADMASAQARARSTGASKLAAKDACSASLVELARLDPGGVAGQGHQAVDLALQLQGRVQVALPRLGLFHVAFHDLHRAPVGVLQLLLEGQGLAPVAPVADHRQGTFL